MSKLDETLERCPAIGDSIRAARREWAALSEDARSEMRSARSAVRPGRCVLGAGAERVASIATGELLTGDEPVERRVTDALSEMSARLLSDYSDAETHGRIRGVGATFGNLYEFRDKYGPYLEVMDRYAFSASLDLPELQTSLCRGHDGEGMATTRTGRVRLAADEYGLLFAAAVNRDESDADNLVRKLLNGSTPADTSVGAGPRGYSGEWNEDMTEYRILRWSLSRGEISVVRAGANPGGWAEAADERGLWIGVEVEAENKPDSGDETDEEDSDELSGWSPVREWIEMELAAV